MTIFGINIMKCISGQIHLYNTHVHVGLYTQTFSWHDTIPVLILASYMSHLSHYAHQILLLYHAFPPSGIVTE